MRVLVWALLVSSLSVVGLAPPAAAERECHTETVTKTLPDGTIQTIVKVVCTNPGDDPDGGGDGGCFSSPGHQIPCTRNGAVWIDSHFCYALNVSDVYPAGHPYWKGHTDGSLWACWGIGPNMDPSVGPVFWLAEGGTPVIDPAVLAQRALDQMPLATPNIHMAPQPPLMTYVGLETWLWMDPGQWDPLTMTVSAGATSVTVVAEPVSAEWDLTAGSTTCTSAGRPWVQGMSSSEQTDCSYTFDQVSDGQADGEFAVSSTLTYQVDWTCSGVCLTGNGTLGEVDGLPGAAAIRVGERQSVVVR